MIKLITCLALVSVLTAEAAYAQSKRAPTPDDVRAGERVIGRDPDPFIRGEILRHWSLGWPD
jgi:hypothetical protein